MVTTVIGLMFRKKPGLVLNKVNTSENFESLESMILQEELKFTFAEVVKAVDDFHEKYLHCIRHRNIMRLYEYLKRGSLGKALYGAEGVNELGWPNRVKIVQGLDQALSYLHHDCSPPIVHRDVTVNNVLLESDFEVRLSDFGIASFGVVALEVMIGRHPEDMLESQLQESSKSRRSNVESLLKDLLDQRLEPPTNASAKAVVLVVTIALACIERILRPDRRWYLRTKTPSSNSALPSGTVDNQQVNGTIKSK
ncbi:MDIS1-interacting receptor like kinase 2-like [Pyrus x bretschneideri]|uniref:MDIS1-interacting receptor like kinase 2-like n=1 Tax=Pyrus x bretschneideri TaxID=225117 RepID=UPI00202ECF1A|nr:MDIS1-interacting receptor like kinase 2-like [Pyrus x bretschneideri]